MYSQVKATVLTEG